MQEEIDPKGIDKKMLADALCIVSRANAEQPVGIKVVEKEVPVEVKVPVEKIVEKCIEVPVIKEVIKEVKVPVEVEVPVEKVIEKEVIKEVVNELDEEKLAALCAIIQKLNGISNSLDVVKVDIKGAGVAFRTVNG